MELLAAPETLVALIASKSVFVLFFFYLLISHLRWNLLNFLHVAEFWLPWEYWGSAQGCIYNDYQGFCPENSLIQISISLECFGLILLSGHWLDYFLHIQCVLDAEEQRSKGAMAEWRLYENLSKCVNAPN